MRSDDDDKHAGQDLSLLLEWARAAEDIQDPPPRIKMLQEMTMARMEERGRQGYHDQHSGASRQPQQPRIDVPPDGGVLH